jgi:transcriptional regulator of acetoin/glycerol metabolism
MVRLQATPWPGNVRELKQVVDVASAFARDVMDDDALELAFSNRESPRSPARLGGNGEPRDHRQARDQLVERRALVELLETAAWDTSRAATMLGIHRATIYRRMKRHGIEIRTGSRGFAES